MRNLRDDHSRVLLSGTHQVLCETRRLVEALTDEQLLWRPNRDRWSIAQCYEHLILTGRAYYPLIEEAIDSATPVMRVDEQSYRPTLFERVFLFLGAPRVRIPLKSHHTFRPPLTVLADAPERFCLQQHELQALIGRSASVDLRTKVRAPHSKFLGMRLGATLELMVQHQMRHLYQAHEVAEEGGFSVREREME